MLIIDLPWSSSMRGGRGARASRLIFGVCGRIRITVLPSARFSSSLASMLVADGFLEIVTMVPVVGRSARAKDRRLEKPSDCFKEAASSERPDSVGECGSSVRDALYAVLGEIAPPPPVWKSWSNSLSPHCEREIFMVLAEVAGVLTPPRSSSVVVLKN